MIVYNITIKTEAAIAPQWLKWLATEHAPAMVATGCFYDFHILQLLEVDDSEGPTFAVQFYAHTAAHYEQYRENFEKRFQQKAAERWGSRFVSFSTLMQTAV